MTCIYIGHPRSIDFQNDLYEPIKSLPFATTTQLVLPHETPEKYVDTKKLFNSGCSLFIADVSEAATGLGMELAYADVYGVPVLAVHAAGTKVSSSVPPICVDVVSYENAEDLRQKLLVLLPELLGKTVMDCTGQESSAEPPFAL